MADTISEIRLAASTFEAGSGMRAADEDQPEFPAIVKFCTTILELAGCLVAY
jgi:hypothetical protein